MTQFERCKQKFKSILFFHSISLVKHFGSTLCFWWCPFERGGTSLWKNLPRIFRSPLCCCFFSFWAREKKKKPYFLGQSENLPQNFPLFPPPRFVAVAFCLFGQELNFPLSSFGRRKNLFIFEQSERVFVPKWKEAVAPCTKDSCFSPCFLCSLPFTHSFSILLITKTQVCGSFFFQQDNFSLFFFFFFEEKDLIRLLLQTAPSWGKLSFGMEPFWYESVEVSTDPPSGSLSFFFVFSFLFW